jgi:hypothetical protein
VVVDTYVGCKLMYPLLMYSAVLSFEYLRRLAPTGAHPTSPVNGF